MSFSIGVMKNVVRKRREVRRSSSKMRDQDLSTTIKNFTPEVLERVKKEVSLT